MLYPTQTATSDDGSLRVSTTSFDTKKAVPGAKITISYTGEPDRIIEEITTDESGNSEIISLPAPPIEYSMEPRANQPYSEYNISVSAPGYETVLIDAIEVLP